MIYNYVSWASKIALLNGSYPQFSNMKNEKTGFFEHVIAPSFGALSYASEQDKNSGDVANTLMGPTGSVLTNAYINTKNLFYGSLNKDALVNQAVSLSPTTIPIVGSLIKNFLEGLKDPSSYRRWEHNYKEYQGLN
jgi:hypothetical protein